MALPEPYGPPAQSQDSQRDDRACVERGDSGNRKRPASQDFDHPDLPKANHALQVLRQARLSRNEAAAVMIGDLIYEIANSEMASHAV